MSGSVVVARVADAVRAALAAMGAWLVGNFLPGEFSDYAYAAALGAFVATGTTLFTIARTAAQQAAGLVIGAVIGLLALPLDVPGLVKIGAIAAVGVLAQGVSVLGKGAAMVPVAAVLVILFGGVDADGYAIGYVGQFSLGMAVGILVNAVAMPPLYDKEARQGIHRAVVELSQRMEELAGMLQGPWPPDRDDWLGWGPELEDWVTDVDEELREAQESRRLNPRTLWRRTDLGGDSNDVATLHSLVGNASSIINALSGAAWATPVAVTLDEQDRRALADAVGAVAGHLQAWGRSEGIREASAAAGRAIDLLYAQVAAREQPESGAGAVVFSLRAMKERVDAAVS